MPPKAGSSKRRPASEEDSRMPRDLLGGAAVKSNLPPIPSKISTAYGSPIEAAPIRRKRRENMTLKDVVAGLIEDATQDDDQNTPSQPKKPTQPQTSGTQPGPSSSSPLPPRSQSSRPEGPQKPQKKAPVVQPPEKTSPDGSGSEHVSPEPDFGPSNIDSEDELTAPVRPHNIEPQGPRRNRTEDTPEGQRPSSQKRTRDDEMLQQQEHQFPPSKRPRTATPTKQPHLRVQPEETPPSGPRRLTSRPATPGVLSSRAGMPAGLSGRSSRTIDELESLFGDAFLEQTPSSSAKAPQKANTPVVPPTESQSALKLFSRLGVPNTGSSQPGLPLPKSPVTSSPRPPPDTPTPGPSRSNPARPQSRRTATPSQQTPSLPQKLGIRRPGATASGSGDPDEPSQTSESSSSEEEPSPKLPPRRRPGDPREDSRRSRSRSPQRHRTPLTNPPVRDPVSNLHSEPSSLLGRGLLGTLAGTAAQAPPVSAPVSAPVSEALQNPGRSLFNQIGRPPAVTLSVPPRLDPVTLAPIAPTGYQTVNTGPRHQDTPRPKQTANRDPDDQDGSDDEDSSEDGDKGNKHTGDQEKRRVEDEDGDEGRSKDGNERNQHASNKATRRTEDRETQDENDLEAGDERTRHTDNQAARQTQPSSGPVSAVSPRTTALNKLPPSQQTSANTPNPGPLNQPTGFFPPGSFSRPRAAAQDLPRTNANGTLSLRSRTVQRPGPDRQPSKSPLRRGMDYMRDVLLRKPDGDDDDPDSPGDGGGGGDGWGNRFRRHAASGAKRLRSWLAIIRELLLALWLWLVGLWRRFLAPISYYYDTWAGTAAGPLIFLILALLASNFIFGWVGSRNQLSAHDDVFGDGDASSYNPFSVVRQWFDSSSDLSLIPSTLARLLPLWAVRPGALWSPDSAYHIESKLRDMEFAVNALKHVDRVQELAIAGLDKILPELVHMPANSEGKLKIQPAFFEALKDLLRKDQDILTLESGADGLRHISDSHYDAVKSRLDSDLTGVGLANVEVYRMIDERAPSAWMDWVERNKEKVQRALGINNLSSVVTREDFLRELQKEFAKHQNQVMSDVRSFLQESGQGQIQQLIKQALKDHDPQSRKTRKEVVGLVDERIKALLGRAGLSALADSKINGLWETDLLNSVNFFGRGTGAVIDVKHTSPGYEPPKGNSAKIVRGVYDRIWRPKPGPSYVALQSWDEFGECWCGSTTETRFGQPNGVSLSVIMGHTIEPEYVVVEHIPPSRSLDPEAAPKDMEVWAHIEDADLRQRAVDVSMTQMNPEGLKPYDEEKYVQIGSFRYDPESAQGGVFVYRIPEAMQDIGFATDHITLRAVTNHGAADYTCLYRARMYGKKVDVA